MERPSHSNFRIAHPFSSRVALSGLAIWFPLALLWALTHGMAGHFIADPGPLHYVPDRDTAKPRTPPPPLPVLTHVPPVTMTVPQIPAPSAQPDSTFAVPVTPPILRPVETATLIADRPATGVMSTHTIPPYPALAQRLGEQGKVTLRLTVQADGHVGKAEIVTSSGYRDLDEAAQAWIVAHWLYKPASANGQPMSSQVTASVIFNLADLH